MWCFWKINIFSIRIKIMIHLLRFLLFLTLVTLLFCLRKTLRLLLCIRDVNGKILLFLSFLPHLLPLSLNMLPRRTSAILSLFFNLLTSRAPNRFGFTHTSLLLLLLFSYLTIFLKQCNMSVGVRLCKRWYDHEKITWTWKTWMDPLVDPSSII